MERKQRLNSLFHQKIAEVISRRLDLPLDFLITIVKVDTSPDLENAKIYFTVLPNDKKDEGLKYLIKNSSEIKRWLAKEVELRRIPKFRFLYEDAENRVQEIEEILDNLKNEDGN